MTFLMACVLLSCIISIVHATDIMDILFPETMESNQEYGYYIWKFNWKNNAETTITWKDEHTTQGFGTHDVAKGYYALYKEDGDKWTRVHRQRQADTGALTFDPDLFQWKVKFQVFGIATDEMLQTEADVFVPSSKFVKSDVKMWEKTTWKRSSIIALVAGIVLILVLAFVAFFCYQFVWNDDTDEEVEKKQVKPRFPQQRHQQHRQQHPQQNNRQAQHQQTYGQPQRFGRQQNTPGWRTA